MSDTDLKMSYQKLKDKKKYQKRLLDTFHSTNFANTAIENDENISICTEVDDAYRNLIQMKNNNNYYNLGLGHLDSIELITSINENKGKKQLKKEISIIFNILVKKE